MENKVMRFWDIVDMVLEHDKELVADFDYDESDWKSELTCAHIIMWRAEKLGIWKRWKEVLLPFFNLDQIHAVRPFAAYWLKQKEPKLTPKKDGWICITRRNRRDQYKVPTFEEKFPISKSGNELFKFDNLCSRWGYTGSVRDCLDDPDQGLMAQIIDKSFFTKLLRYDYTIEAIDIYEMDCQETLRLRELAEKFLRTAGTDKPLSYFPMNFRIMLISGIIKQAFPGPITRYTVEEAFEKLPLIEEEFEKALAKMK